MIEHQLQVMGTFGLEFVTKDSTQVISFHSLNLRKPCQLPVMI